MKSCYICLGSNYEQGKHIEMARKQLKKHFPNIYFATEELTKPIMCNRKESFINQVALFQTDVTQNDLVGLLKKIEEQCGRNVCDKLQEIVRIDIDLLIYNNNIIKPNDICRDYVKRGMIELKNITFNL